MNKFVRQVFYNVCFFLVFLFAWPYLTFRLWRRGKLSRYFWHRVGLYSRELRIKLAGGSDLWIHAVSVGEMMIAAVLIRRLRELQPDLRIVLSTTTATGFKVAQKHENELTTVIYNPTDFLWSVRQAFELIRPKMLILVEAEIWPNYIWCAKRRQIPVFLVNARLSSRSEERFHRFRFFTRPVLQEIDLVFAQDSGDVARLTRAGFASESIFNLGSLKYDVADIPSSSAVEVDGWWKNSGWRAEDPVLLGGSTHSGEEEIVARIYANLKEQWPSLRLVLAPRHAERGPQIKQLCENLGLRAVLRTELDAPLSNGHVPEALVLNTTGELNAVYPKATLAFIGKSLRARGGQNFIEAARVGTPIIVGPNMQNFRNLAQEFVRRGALIQINDEFELSQKIRELLASKELRDEVGELALRTFRENLGAGKKTAELILEALRRSKAWDWKRTLHPAGTSGAPGFESPSKAVR